MSNFIEKIDDYIYVLENPLKYNQVNPQNVEKNRLTTVLAQRAILDELKLFRTEINELEQEDEYYPVYKEFTYNSSGDLIKQEIYTDGTKVEKLYELTYIYDNGILTTQNILKVPSNIFLVKTFNYDSNSNLINININTNV